MSNVICCIDYMRITIYFHDSCLDMIHSIFTFLKTVGLDTNTLNCLNGESECGFMDTAIDVTNLNVNIVNTAMTSMQKNIKTQRHCSILILRQRCRHICIVTFTESTKRGKHSQILF